MLNYGSLVSLLIERKDENEKGIRFILDNNEERFVSYQDLFHISVSLLYNLQQFGFKKGDEVVFQIEDNQLFIYAFWACIFGGFIPVPVTAGINDENRSKLVKIWNLLNNPKLITSHEFAEKNKTISELCKTKDKLVFVEDMLNSDAHGEISEADLLDIALIQFSSGSTGEPKGVIVTHKNILINLSAALKRLKIDSGDVSLNWMPLTHDMGLIGAHIKSVLANINQLNISTSSFVLQPNLWLEKASEHKVSILYSPNFGYKHLLKFYKDDGGKIWDLSSVRVILNGAEPISSELCDEFLAKMAQYNLNRSAMLPVYGLAEGTIAVTIPKIGDELKTYYLNRKHLKVADNIIPEREGSNESVSFVGVGYAVDNCAIKIFDENNLDLKENRIGYINIKGESVTSGYYNNAKATNEAISSGRWLNTGDLGFITNNRLVVTGRAKDIIFYAGQNFYAHDVERVAENVTGIELGNVAAIGLFNQEKKCDELIMFVRFKKKLEDFVQLVFAVKTEINLKMGIEVAEVIPIRRIPKTTSGKVQRYKLRESYSEGDFNNIVQMLNTLYAKEQENKIIVLPQNAIEDRLGEMWKEILNLDKISITDNFFSLGGDSLKITQLISRMQDSFGVEMRQALFFNNPTIKEIAKIIENAEEFNFNDRIIRGRVQDSCLSFSQQRLWFLYELDKEASQYNLYKALKLHGSLNINSLKISLNEVIKRHRILQTSFHEEKGQPIQIINMGLQIDIPLVDLMDLPEQQREKKALNLAKEGAARPFRLEEAPLLRGFLFKIEEYKFIFVLVVHHIIFDGWSFQVLINELTSFYENSLNEITIEEPCIQYSDYSLWQNQKLLKGKFNDQLDYWKKQLSGEMHPLNLPFARKRLPIASYRGAKFIYILHNHITKSLKELALKENATLFMILLTAFKVLLYRYTKQNDIVVGSPIANRNKREIENTIGFFTNNLVLRTNISGEKSFRELIGEIKEITLEAYENQDLPFEKLVEELHVERDLSRNPLFQVFFSLQNIPSPDPEFSDLDVSDLELNIGTSRFDLSLDIRAAGESLITEFEYNTDLFEIDTITRMAGHYKQLLAEAIANPSGIIDEYNIIPKNEKAMMLKHWNDTDIKFKNSELNWVKLFEYRTKRTPDAVAVIGSANQMTYGELNQASNQLANYLISLGVKEEVIVGIYLERTPLMLVALLAIHKANGAYLPLDPAFPKERLLYMLENSKASIVLTENLLIDTLPANRVNLICVDKETNKIGQFSRVNPEFSCNPRNLAYVLYTSGSTGNPKGVQIEQRSLMNFLLSMTENLGHTEKDSLLAITTLSFDISGLELFMPLINGAKVVLANREEATDAIVLNQMINDYDITIMQATPATWRLLLESGWAGKKDLTILCGGEAWPQNLAENLINKCNCLWNVYGPTETTIWSTMLKVDPVKAISMGKPIANTKLYILDNKMNLLPIGVPGELYIGGEGVARGYLGEMGLTNEKFVPDIFTDNENSKLFKTGDMVKYLPDGNVVFIDRMDFQVKIRGYRIELEEIESILLKYESISECVVITKEILPGDLSLIAYIILGIHNFEFIIGDLRDYLREKLPAYMIPAHFVVKEQFPLTPNGKTDRKALQKLEVQEKPTDANYMAPVKGMEKRILEIWQDTLKLKIIGIDDNFFDIGGHSLLLSQVRSKIVDSLNENISMLDLFKYPTVRSLARFIEGGETDNPKQPDLDKNRASLNKSQEIAVIGLSGRFPGAKDIEQFWKNICNGVESISIVTDAEVLESGVRPELLENPQYVKAWGVLEDIEKFDANFFGYNPKEAELLDPQQRVFLEETWRALENAGYDTQKYAGSVGVYASVGLNLYREIIYSSNKSADLAHDYQIMISNDKDFLATRVAYKLNLEGPAVTVQTACSSSLVAVHMASQSLNRFECDMALAGGVSIRLPQKRGYLYQEGMILSPDGHCRAFAEDAKGTVGGNGAGVVVLKRMEDAIADGDNIIAVIKGTAINNDGGLKVGYTAPRIDGQAAVIKQAISQANILPESISYIEAHGTGTPFGDPIEIAALNKVFNTDSGKKYCKIGSVKTNIGHLDAASGIAGLIKTILSLHNKKLPPSLHFNKPNPKIEFENGPLSVNTTLVDWESGTDLLRAGVSSFGIGGTNAHVVLEEALVLLSDGPYGEYLLILSAKTHNELEIITKNLADFLKANPSINIADVAYTLQVGRRSMDKKKYFICSCVEDAIAVLTGTNLEKSADKEHPLEKLGQKWINGDNIDWGGLYAGSRRRRVALPVYPFKGRKYWIEAKDKNELESPEKRNIKKADISEWFYTPIWKQSTKDKRLPDVINIIEQETIFIITEKNDFSQYIVDRIKALNGKVILAQAGENYSVDKNGIYTFDPKDQSHYKEIMRDLAAGKPQKIINMLGITLTAEESNIDIGERLFFSMLYLAQAIGEATWEADIDIRILLNNSVRLYGEKYYSPQKALSLGPCRVIPREYPNLKCAIVDIVIPDCNDEIDGFKDTIITELYSEIEDNLVAYRGDVKFIQGYENIKLDDSLKSAIKLKNDGVYLIAGGTGGIGLALAEVIVNEVNANLILISNQSLPPQEKWDEWSLTFGDYNEISLIIKKIKSFIATGSQVKIINADITSPEDLTIVRETVSKDFGKIDGIIHAAGYPGGGMIQLKNYDMVQKVFKPKVAGTMALFEAFEGISFDFFIICSSLNAITGGFGQVDYCAANAFQDAFAQTNKSRGEKRLISINWDRWSGVGMASAAKLQIKGESIHPLLGKCIINTGEEIVFLSEISPEKNWVLSEHLVLGMPTVAGTTYLEMARAAFVELKSIELVDISDVLFLTPLAVKAGEKRQVCTIIKNKDTRYDFMIISKPKNDSTFWTEHASGKIAHNKDFIVSEIAIKDILDNNSLKPIEISSKIAENDFIIFGDRWNCLNSIYASEYEAIVEVELPAKFESELQLYKLHPALLDVITGSCRLITGGNYLPFSYRKIKIRGNLDNKLFGYLKFKNTLAIDSEVITIDVDIVDENAQLLAKISDFSMKLVSLAAAQSLKTSAQAVILESKYPQIDKIINRLYSSLTDALNEGIEKEEGKEAFRRILMGFNRSQIIVSPKEIDIAIKQANYIEKLTDKAGGDSNEHVGKPKYPRPDLDNEYIAPKTAMEKKLVKIWGNVLAIENIGTQDAFFDLGGDSLLLIQLHTALKKAFAKEIAAVDLYKYTTVSSLAKYYAMDNTEERQPAFEDVINRAQKQLDIRQRKQMMRRKFN